MSERLPDFGDLIRAFVRLRPTDEVSKREIANLLGFDYVRPLPPVPIAPPPPVTPQKPIELQTTPVDHTPSSDRRTFTDSPQSSSSNPFNTDLRPAVLRPLASTAIQPNWGTATPLELPPATRQEPPRLEPLLVPRWTRGILSAALGGRGAEGEIDIDAIVRTISSGRPFRTVPRRNVPRFGRGVQVLVDASETMMPFLEDQTWLTERIRVVAGRDRTQVLGIEGSDSFIAGEGMRLDWTDYFASYVPPEGVVAILLSDLGIGRMSMAPWTSPAQWLEFARGLQKCGVPLVAIVPYARERWPAELRRAIPIVQWDTRTTARSARRALETRLRQNARSTS
jgi:hypothetical protein